MGQQVSGVKVKAKKLIVRRTASEYRKQRTDTEEKRREEKRRDGYLLFDIGY